MGLGAHTFQTFGFIKTPLSRRNLWKQNLFPKTYSIDYTVLKPLRTNPICKITGPGMDYEIILCILMKSFCIHLNFSDLRNLFLGANQISEIPSEIKVFKRLKVLYLGGNSLTQLPEEICQLQRLQALILAQNELKSLPNCICNLKKLETLQLHQVTLPTSSYSLISIRQNYNFDMLATI